MQVNVKNYRGIAEATLTLAPIALVCGPNHAGKSSIAQAVAGALTRNAAVLEGVTKSAAGQLLRDGAKRGNCTVGDDAGSVTVNWPGASVSEQGTGPRASVIACGLESIVGMKQKDAAATLIRVIDAHPTIEHFRAAVAPAGVGDELVQQVWSVVQADGWDAAHNRARERGAKLKGQWEQITGEAWGSKKAEGWRPVGLTEDLPALDDLEAESEAIRQELEAAIANQAAGAERVAQLQAAIEAGNAAMADSYGIADFADAQDVTVANLRAELNALPRPETPENLVECPRCKGHLVVVSRTEVRIPAGTLSADENAERQAAIEVKQVELQEAERVARNYRQELDNLSRVHAAGKKAEADLAALPTEGATAEQIATIRQRQADHGRLIGAVRAVHGADHLHRGILASAELVAALAPNGVRHTVLTERLGTFNATLEDLSRAAGWAQVHVEPDLSVTFGARPFVLLSASEQFRVRTVLQVAMASMDGSEAVIVDAADILDRGGRNGLFRMLQFSGLRALVCMTMNRVGDVPDISSAGIGRSYWIADATLAPCGA